MYLLCYSSLSTITPTTVFTHCVAELSAIAICAWSEPHCRDSTIVNWSWIRCGESLLLNLYSVFICRDWGKLCKIVGRNGDLTLAWIKIYRKWALGWPNLSDYVCVDNKQQWEMLCKYADGSRSLLWLGSTPFQGNCVWQYKFINKCLLLPLTVARQYIFL